jgi:hypothetical protein
MGRLKQSRQRMRRERLMDWMSIAVRTILLLVEHIDRNS